VSGVRQVVGLEGVVGNRRSPSGLLTGALRYWGGGRANLRAITAGRIGVVGGKGVCGRMGRVLGWSCRWLGGGGAMPEGFGLRLR